MTVLLLLLLLIASTRAGRIGIIPVWLKLLPHHRRWGSACLFIHPERGSKRRNEGRDALSASRSYIYFRSRRRSSARTRSRKSRERRDEMPLQKSRFSSPVTHRKSFAAAAAAAAEAARHRTKKGEVGTRSFEAPPLTFFVVAFFFRSRKRKRERERESACSYNRENWTLNELGKFRDFFYPQKCNQRYFVIIITTDHSLRRLSLRARTTEGRPRRSGEERICA